MNLFESFLQRSKKVVPVITLPSLDSALPLMDVLAANGFTVVEITLRTDCAVDAIELLTRERPQLIVGAGTVKNTQQLHAVLNAGAHFIVSPGFDPELVQQARKSNVPIIPGVMTPSELMQAENAGAEIVKLFPATLAGGVEFITAMQAVFPKMKFFPTGGITEATVQDFLHCKNVVCAGGSWLTPTKLVQQQDWSGIREIALRCP